MADRLRGKVALITGGGTGIGAATARRFAREGAQVVICGRRRPLLDAVAREIEKDGGRAEAHALDVADEASFGPLIESLAARHGRLDILVNNAFSAALGPIETLSTEAWHASFRVTLDAVFFALRAALPLMARQGGGSIVNVGSTAGHGGLMATSGYATAKAGLENLTRCAAVEGAPGKVRVNTVTPGPVATEMAEAAFSAPGVRAAMEARVPLGRFAHPDEIAAGILFVASDEASFMTGACLVLDGGQLAALGSPRLD